MALDVEVIIVSYDSSSALAETIESIAASMPGARVALREHADDDAAERVQRVLDTAPLPIRFEHDPSNPGFGAGCNAAARTSTAAWLLFLNPDARVRAWPFDIERPLAPAVIGPMYTEDTADHWGRRYRISDEIARSWFRRAGRQPEGTGFVSGAAMLIDTATFRAVGGFDERYFLFYEDIDLCLRANAIGTPTVVERRWIVAHERGHSTRDRRAEALRWSYDSACRFHTERGSPVWAYRWYVAADACLRTVAHAARRDRSTARAYAGLARKAVSDSARGRRSRP